MMQCGNGSVVQCESECSLHSVDLLQWFQSRWHVWAPQFVALYGPRSKSHLGVCAIYSETTAVYAIIWYPILGNTECPVCAS